MSRPTTLTLPSTAAARTAAVAAMALLLLGSALTARAQDGEPPRTTVPGGATAAGDAAGWSQLTFADGAAPTVLVATDADLPTR